MMIVKSKWTKTNQESPIGFNYYKLIYIFEKHFYRRISRWNIVWFTVWLFLRLYELILLWVDCFTNFNHQTQKEPKKKSTRSLSSTVIKLHWQRVDLHQKTRLPTVSENRRIFQAFFSEQSSECQSHVQTVHC